MKQPRPLGQDFSPKGSIQGVAVGQVPQAQLDTSMRAVLTQVGLMHAASEPARVTSERGVYATQEARIRIGHIHFPDITQRQSYLREDILSMMEAIRKNNGIVNKIVVRPDTEKVGHYFVIEGGTRLQALLTMYGENHEEPCIVKQVDELEGFWMGLMLNEERNPLTDYDKGMAFAKLIKAKKVTHEKIRDYLKLSSTALTFLLSYAELPEACLDIIGNHKNSFPSNIAYQLKRLQEHCGEDVVTKLVKKIVSETWTQAKVRAYVDKKVEENTDNPRRKRRQSVTFGDYGQAKTTNDAIELKLEKLNSDQIESILKSINACLNSLQSDTDSGHR